MGYRTDIGFHKPGTTHDELPDFPEVVPTCVCCCSASPSDVPVDDETPLPEASDTPSDVPSPKKLSWDDIRAAPEEYVISHLTRDQARLLWHQRLGHLSYRRVKKAQQTATRIPQGNQHSPFGC